jgi:hypothetical protein
MKHPVTRFKTFICGRASRPQPEPLVASTTRETPPSSLAGPATTRSAVVDLSGNPAFR